jgi:hypothetical protein
MRQSKKKAKEKKKKKKRKKKSPEIARHSTLTLTDMHAVPTCAFASSQTRTSKPFGSENASNFL